MYGSAQSAAALDLQTLNEEEQASVSASRSVTEDSSLNKGQESFSHGLVSPQRCCEDCEEKKKTVTLYDYELVMKNPLKNSFIHAFVCVFCVYVHGCISGKKISL